MADLELDLEDLDKAVKKAKLERDDIMAKIDELNEEIAKVLKYRGSCFCLSV